MQGATSDVYYVEQVFRAFDAGDLMWGIRESLVGVGNISRCSIPIPKLQHALALAFHVYLSRNLPHKNRRHYIYIIIVRY